MNRDKIIEENIKKHLFSKVLLQESQFAISNFNCININPILNLKNTRKYNYINIFLNLLFQEEIKKIVKISPKINTDSKIIYSTCLPFVKGDPNNFIARKNKVKVDNNKILQDYYDNFSLFQYDTKEKIQVNHKIRKTILEQFSGSVYPIVQTKQYKEKEPYNTIAFDTGLIMNNLIKKHIKFRGFMDAFIHDKHYELLIKRIENMIEKSLYDTFIKGNNDIQKIILSRNFIKDFYHKDLSTDNIEYKTIQYFEDIYCKSYKPSEKIID